MLPCMGERRDPVMIVGGRYIGKVSLPAGA
jgi:hypothetical protein